ncbi:hypothetical protein D3C86_1399040 [compost metagenome]
MKEKTNGTNQIIGNPFIFHEIFVGNQKTRYCKHLPLDLITKIKIQHENIKYQYSCKRSRSVFFNKPKKYNVENYGVHQLVKIIVGINRFTCGHEQNI